MTAPQPLLDITEAAEHIRQPVSALRGAVRDKQLRHIRRGHGGKLWFRPEWLHAWIDSLEDTEAAS
jgi:hypothetical protein